MCRCIVNFNKFITLYLAACHPLYQLAVALARDRDQPVRPLPAGSDVLSTPPPLRQIDSGAGAAFLRAQSTVHA